MADYVILIVFKEIFGLYYLVSIALGFIVGLTLTYILSNRYVFGTPKSTHKVIFTFFTVIGLGGLAILSLLVWVLTSKFGLNYILSKTLATFIVFMWNFFARRALYQTDSKVL